MLEKKREAGKREHRYERLSCPLVGQILPASGLPCTTNSTLRLDQHLLKHGLSGAEKEAALVRARTPADRNNVRPF